jgi:hypothetical protein
MFYLYLSVGFIPVTWMQLLLLFHYNLVNGMFNSIIFHLISEGIDSVVFDLAQDVNFLFANHVA